MRKEKRGYLIVLGIFMMIFLLPMNIKAAQNKMKPLDNYRTYTNHDVTGDGKRDRFRFDFEPSGDSTIYLNGKIQKIRCYSTAKLHLCNAGKNGAFLVLNYGRGQCEVLTYKNGEFKTIFYFENYSWGEIYPIKYVDNVLYMKTMGYFKRRNPLSFTLAGKIDMYAIYKFRFEKGNIKLASKYGTVKDLSKTRIAMNSFATSSTYKLTDKKGTKVSNKSNVIVKKCYRGNQGFDDWRFLISVRGKTGWFRSCDNIQLY